MSRRPTRSRYGLAGSLLFVVLLVAACAFDAVELAGRDCPCVDGWVCDARTNHCVRPEDLIATGGSDGGGTDATADSGPACTGAGCACERDQDCADPAFGKCVEKKCRECARLPDSCPAGKYCLDTFQCAPGCKLDAECAGGDAGTSFCQTTRHQCVECLVAGDCGAQKLCSPSGKCVEGCDLDAGKTCAAGTCCSSLCLDTTDDVFNCGACGAPCTGGDTLCCGGSCANPLTSTTHCGGCDLTCSTTNGTPNCTAGSCKWTCNNGFAHCGTGNTGCETPTTNDPLHCGSCTTICANAVKNATGIGCSNSSCTYTACNPGYANCDGIAGNGCETSTTGDATKCGGCNTNCNNLVLNANGIICTNSACNYTSCKSGFGDCNGNRADGCECVCGGVEQQCCPGGGCIAGLLCEVGGDNRCH